MPDKVGNPVATCPRKMAPMKESKPKEVRHSVNFNIVDDKGAPLANIVIKVLLPDGSYEEKTSNAQGKIEIKNIKPGNCKIESDWKKLKVDDIVLIQ